MKLTRKEIEAVLNHIPCGITLQDKTGKVVYANERAIKLVGYKTATDFLSSKPGELSERFIIKDQSGKLLPFEELPGRRALASKKQEENIVRFYTKENKKEYWSWVSGIPIRGENSEMIGVLNTFFDLTKVKQSEEAQKILNTISDVFSSSLSYEIKLKRLAQTLVPKIADWCAIDILDEKNKLQRVAVAHVDADKVQLAKDFQNTYPPQENDQFGIMKTIRTGKVEIFPHISPEIITKAIKDPEQRELILRLQINSVVIVPLQVAGKTIGAITFAHAESKRTLSRDDVSLLKTFAFRAAILLENARLYQAAQRMILKQRETYKALLESESSLRLAFDVGKMGIWDWDIQNDEFTWSDGLKPLYGFRRGNKEGSLKQFLEHIYAPDRKRVHQNLLKSVKNVGEYEDEFRIVWPDKTVHWMLKKGQVLNDGEGKAVRLIGIGMDITERKVSELALKQSENKFRSIFDTSLDSIVVTDDALKIIETNEAMSHLLMTSQDMLNNTHLLKLLTHPSAEHFAKQWKQLQKTGFQRGEVEIIRTDGSTIIVEYSVKAQFLPNRNLIILRDITDRKEEEKRRGHLLGIASHELRTPLASIKAFIEILKRHFSKIENENIHYYLSKIDDKTEYLSQLINDLLDMTRIREGKLDIHYEMFDFDPFLDEVVNDLSIVNKSAQITRIGKLKHSIIADRNRIAQVIINVVKNAIKYSKKIQKVVIRTKKIQDDVLISIQDFGLGIPKADQKKIFEIYYRVDRPSTRSVNGLGVGLYISAEIVKKHQGKIWVESTIGKGSTVFILLPLVPKSGKKSNTM